MIVVVAMDNYPNVCSNPPASVVSSTSTPNRILVFDTLNMDTHKITL
jgi:hypothetical protein